MFKSILWSCILVFASSRLILPQQIDELQAQQLPYLNPKLKTQDSPTDSNSSAHPVEGIANATSGYLSVNDPNSNSKLFYIFYQCRNLSEGQSATEVPIIIWLQGGPGGTSQAGNIYEHGPYKLVLDNSTGKFKESPRDLSWNDHFNMLYIDQPRGTGYSIADKNSYLTREDEVDTDFLNALLNFYALDQFEPFLNTPLYIFGESYAGHFVPSFSKKIMEYNAQGLSPKIPLIGAAIGNGLTDPPNQLSENAAFAYSLGLLDEIERAEIESYQLQGAGNIINGQWLSAQMDFGYVITNILSYGGGLNVYNFRDFGTYNFTSMITFFNDEDTVKRYNVDSSVAGEFIDLNMNVFNNLSNSYMQTVAPNVSYIVDNGLPYMVYNGQDDIVCNTPGVQNWVTNLEWAGQDGLYKTPFNVWIYQNGTVAGLQKNYKNFYFVIVNKAGHLAPMNQIETTTEMVRRFVNKQTNWTQPFKG